MHTRMNTPAATRTLAYFHQRKHRFVSSRQAPAEISSACPSGYRPLFAVRLAGVPSRESLPGGESFFGDSSSVAGRFRKPLGLDNIDLGLIQKGDGLIQLDCDFSELDAGLFESLRSPVEIDDGEFRSRRA